MEDSIGISARSEEAIITSKPRRQRYLNRRVQLALDLMVFASAFILAYLLRFDFDLPREYWSRALVQLLFVVLIQLAAMLFVGIYTFVWRYVGIVEMRSFLSTAIISVIPILFLRLILPKGYVNWKIPFSVILMDTVLAFGGVMGLRVLRRVLYERGERRKRVLQVEKKHKKPVLLIGAGQAGVITAREIKNRGDIWLDIKGFVDDNMYKQGTVIQQIKVLGTIDDLPQLVRNLKIDHVIITIAQASRQDFRRILDICKSIPIKARVIPGIYEILQGQVNVSRIRDVQIEDLLGRESISLDNEGLSQFLSGKAVMVTGAGGSIGAELARQVARFNPKTLILIERSEPALFSIDRELRSMWPSLLIVPLVADVGDEVRMHSIFTAQRPQVVFHAAAHKHVPMMETNPIEAIKNNTIATHTLGELAGNFATEAFVFVSTDKAVRPTSIMGASKRMAELVIQFLNQRYATKYLAVRFGNVIGSAGSVIPIFREQIQKGGPVTVTHPNMTRYFMTIPEASQLVLQTGAMGDGGEIFILDMGEPVNILRLAQDTITLSGLRPYEDIDIVFTGVRPGEKLFEELEMTGESVAKTRHPKIFIGKISKYPEEQVLSALECLRTFSAGDCDKELRAFLQDLLPESNLLAEPLANEEFYTIPSEQSGFAKVAVSNTGD